MVRPGGRCVALVAPWLVLVAVPTLSPLIVFGGPVVAGFVAGVLADQPARPGLIAGLGYALPALAVVALDPCRADPGWGETAGGAVLLALLGPVVAVVGSRLGARLAHGPSDGRGPLVWLVLGLAGGVVIGTVVVSAQTLVTGC